MMEMVEKLYFPGLDTRASDIFFLCFFWVVHDTNQCYLQDSYLEQSPNILLSSANEK